MRIRLRDGRHVGIEEHGTGIPLIWVPGTPGSRVWKAPFVPAGIRLVIIERPGFGESDPLPGRRYLDWPDDLAQVVDQLGIGDFALAGTSGAGPYLHVCGVKLAYRVRKLGVIACMGPADIADGMPLWRRAALALARVAPQKLVKATLPRDPEALYRMLTRDAPPCDRTILESIWASQVAMTAEALRQGPDAFVYELMLATRPWGFSLADVRAEVVLWHGTEDQAAPLPVAREVARRLPRCTTHFVSGAGHFLHYGRWQEVVDSLIV
jgi:pimeloyl-ACP methyl ester carboxylesterase